MIRRRYSLDTRRRAPEKRRGGPVILSVRSVSPCFCALRNHFSPEASRSHFRYRSRHPHRETVATWRQLRLLVRSPSSEGVIGSLWSLCSVPGLDPLCVCPLLVTTANLLVFRAFVSVAILSDTVGPCHAKALLRRSATPKKKTASGGAASDRERDTQ